MEIPYLNGNELLPCYCRVWLSADYLCSLVEVLRCTIVGLYENLLVCILCYLAEDNPLLSLTNTGNTGILLAMITNLQYSAYPAKQ